ncbi:MAG TPA: OmpH family outer membrane protein [Chitinophagaceae bacterium]|jgi:outer membrane protein|nr:OmpH family outer membrane protein [Chitinophagaceae bacterium]
MNKGLLALNIILLICVGILFFLFFNKKDNTSSVTPARTDPDTAPQWQHTPVAYFDMDSIEANFILWKQVQAEVVKREAGINDTINQMRSGFQSYYQKLQAQSANLSPRQKDSLSNELAQMDAEIKNRTADLNQKYQTYFMTRQQEIVTKIKNYCKEFNKDKKYSYIIAREPGLFYYTDTAYNVTSELLKGLNAFYGKKK